jgi:hypothetical protein
VHLPAPLVVDVFGASYWAAGPLTISGYHADFSVDSLRQVDRFFDDHVAEGRPKPGGLMDESASYRLFALGSYLGHVISG